MKSILPLLVLVCLLNPVKLTGQASENMEENFDEGLYFFNRGDYEDALIYFLKLVAKDSLNANFNFKVGETYLNIPGKEHLAIPYFERSLRKIVPKQSYRNRSFEEKSAPLHAYFYLGNAYRMNNQLNEALESYMKFIDSPYFYNSYNQNVVDREIKSCERAVIIQDAPLELEQINLGPAVNSEFSEEKPVLSADGNTLVFIRKLRFYDAIFCSRKVEGNWQTAVNINPQILSDGEFYPTGLSRDGNELLLVRREGESYNIYSSHFDGEVWSLAVKLPGRINSIFSETHASFSADGNTLFVTSNRRGGKGGLDIWMAKRNQDGTWGKLKNLGKMINTEVDEQMAYQCADQNILFFSSQGHYNMGGNDIFYARSVGKKWKIPVNLGYPINNTRDNLNYCPDSQNCRVGYYSLVDEDSFGGSDIYYLKIKSENVLLVSKTPPEK